MSQEEAVINSSSGGAPAEPKSKIWSVIGASSAGTLIEWYDFGSFGTAFIARIGIGG